jgi:thioesterase domain-containing protein
MSDNEATVRIRAPWVGKTAITPDQAAGLRELYSELQNATVAAAEALGTPAAAPSGMALQRFRELDARVVELVERIRETID